MRYLRFRGWLDGFAADAAEIGAVYFEEVRRHVGTDAAHLYGGFLATLTAWCESHAVANQGAPVGTIKRHLCLIDLKLARLTRDPAHLDSIVDVAGYAACLREVTR